MFIFITYVKIDELGEWRGRFFLFCYIKYSNSFV